MESYRILMNKSKKKKGIKVVHFWEGMILQVNTFTILSSHSFL